MKLIDCDRDTIAGIVEDVLDEHMSLGTSGRYLTAYGMSPSNLAESIADRITSPATTPPAPDTEESQ